MTQATINHADLAAALAAMRVDVGASELHGSLSGYLCGGGTAQVPALLSLLGLEGDHTRADEAGQRLLGELYAETRVQLDDPELGFEPLLPDPARPLAERGDALVNWCRGFLGGLGLGGQANRQGLSEEGAEILHDLDAIAASHFSYEDADDENSLMEVFEFVRIGVLLLYAELRADPGRRLH